MRGRRYGIMHKMQHVEQLATLRLVEHEEETAAAAKGKAPPDVSSSMPAPSSVVFSLTFKNDNTLFKITRHFSE